MSASSTSGARRQIIDDAKASERALKARIDAGGFAVALSGGGHRATLASLGALLAIVDRGLGNRIIQIASVSGGSITNAFVAQRCRIEEMGPEELDEIGAQLATTVIRRGVLTRVWIAFLLTGSAVLGVATGVGLSLVRIPWRPGAAVWQWVTVIAGIGTALAALLGSGLVVDWLLDRRYFRNGPHSRERSRFASLSGGQVDHVLCMTDLALGLPVYVSSQHGGMIWRRLKAERTSFRGVDFHTFDARTLSIAELVRASAAFPGIPPRRLRVPPDSQIDLVAQLPRFAFLADGGLWNNLGSHVLREDQFIGTHADWDRGVLRPYGPAPKSLPLFCFNGSAPLRETRSWWFSVPGVAIFRTALKIASILNANTVLPRVEAMRSAYERRAWSNTRPSFLDPSDLVADLRPCEETADTYRAGSWSREIIQETDPKVKEWERAALIRLRSARQEAERSSETDWLQYVLGSVPEPEGTYPVSGLANYEDWDALRTFAPWKQLVEKAGRDPINVPTTLGRIDQTVARDLIARAYLNTYLVSLFLAPLEAGELDRLKRVSDRLDRIVGLSAPDRDTVPETAHGH